MKDVNVPHCLIICCYILWARNETAIVCIFYKYSSVSSVKTELILLSIINVATCFCW